MMKNFLSKLHRRGILTWMLIFAVVAGILPVSGCTPGRPRVDNAFKIYYVAKDYSKVTAREYIPKAAEDDQEALLIEVLEALATPAEKSSDIPPLSGDMKLLGYEVRSEQLILDFPVAYKKLETIPEILYRAAIVRTLTQIPGITTISFMVTGDPLTDEVGTPVGPMTADSFIDNAGKEISTYEQATLRLYFADESGEKLVKTS
ncbi:MAG: GerMN domain-containing protein, partial [Lachnospiraceae bacterium]|nr:GerMN domain-containing protein [Lachnospiraceae bacterium]